MHKRRMYIDTSVIGGCFDEEFSDWSNPLVQEIEKGNYIAVISDLTRRELEGAPEKVRERLLSLPGHTIEFVELTPEAEELAREYVENKVVSPNNIIDAQHIAIATLERVDVVVSWNFKHIVNLQRIYGFNSINLRLGYPILEIRCPREVLHD